MRGANLATRPHDAYLTSDVVRALLVTRDVLARRASMCPHFPCVSFDAWYLRCSHGFVNLKGDSIWIWSLCMACSGCFWPKKDKIPVSKHQTRNTTPVSTTWYSFKLNADLRISFGWYAAVTVAVTRREKSQIELSRTCYPRWTEHLVSPCSLFFPFSFSILSLHLFFFSPCN